MDELSAEAQKAIYWLLNTRKAEEMTVREARKFICDIYGEEVEKELKELAEIE